MKLARKGCETKKLGEVDFMETKFASLSREILCKARWSTPQGSPRV
jgi:hypothetical protein